MKKTITLFFLFIYIKSYSQSETPADSLPKKVTIQQPLQKEEEDISDRIIFSKTEKSAEFPGGAKAWLEFLTKELNANAPISNGATAGKYVIIIRIVVSKNGTLRDFDIETRYGFGMEEEVIRVLKKSLPWMPAEQNGHKVNSYVRQPITFVVGAK